MVVALGEAGDGDCSDDAGVGDDDGEGAAVGGVVFFGQVVAGGEAEAGLLEQAPDVVGALVEAGDGGDLARDPALVVGRGAGERGVEELLVGRAEAAAGIIPASAAGPPGWVPEITTPRAPSGCCCAGRTPR